MSTLAKFTMAALGLSVASTLALSSPAFAQYDAFSGNGDSPGNLTGNSGPMTGTQTNLTNAPGKGIGTPQLAPAANGTLGPQGANATYVTGVDTGGTVRVNNLANLEALLNIMANGMEILGIAWGGPTMIMGFMHMAAGTQDSMKRVLFGAAGVTGGMATPGVINWLVASARDANLFS